MRDQAHVVADELRRAVHALAPELAGISFPVGTLSISVGIAAIAPDVDETAAWPADDAAVGEALFRAADRALYASKGNGRNRVSMG
jgi:GGDEF domain-containing protein